MTFELLLRAALAMKALSGPVEREHVVREVLLYAERLAPMGRDPVDFAGLALAVAKKESNWSGTNPMGVVRCRRARLAYCTRLGVQILAECVRCTKTLAGALSRYQRGRRVTGTTPYARRVIAIYRGLLARAAQFEEER